MTNNFKNKLFWTILLLGTSISLAILFFYLGVIIYQGIGAISWEFLTSKSKYFGSKGGIFYQIVGSLFMIFVTALISFPISFAIALLKSEYLYGHPRLKKIINLYLYGLNSTPSIIFGLFGFIFFVNLLGFGISWFAGSIILAIMAIPSITLASYQVMNAIPTIYREAGYALGFTRSQVILRIIIPQSFNGAISGLFLGLARAIGETAPIMFIATAVSGATFPTSIFQPCLTLPTHILSLAQNAVEPQAIRNAWGSAFVLMFIVVMFSVASYFMRQNLKKRY